MKKHLVDVVEGHTVGVTYGIPLSAFSRTPTRAGMFFVVEIELF